MTAAEVEAKFPQCVEVARRFRDVFGDGVRLIYALEAGNEMGRQTPDYVSLAQDIVRNAQTGRPSK